LPTLGLLSPHFLDHGLVTVAPALDLEDGFCDILFIAVERLSLFLRKLLFQLLREE
jgi:hypothetical protein